MQRFKAMNIKRLSSLAINRIDKNMSAGLNVLWRPKTCTNVKKWMQTQAAISGHIVCTQVSKPQDFYISLPSTVEQAIHPRFFQKKARRSPYRSPEQYLACIYNARLVNQSGLIVLPGGQYALEPLMTQEHLIRAPEYCSFARRQLAKVKKTRKSGAYYSLLQLYGNGSNPYHWLHDVLQNLYSVIKYLPEDVTYIVPEGLQAWQYESLAAVGINRYQTCSFRAGDIWEIETLFFAPPIKGLGQDLPGLNEWIRAACYKKFNIDSSEIEKDQLVYISRDLARGRKIINEAEVESFLQEKGFNKYFLEEMSFEQIVRLFAKAKTVIAPHGAGLANLIFSQPGTKVIEIFEPTAKEIGACYWSLSTAMNHDYWYLFGERVENDPVPEQPNIKVSIEKIERALWRNNG